MTEEKLALHDYQERALAFALEKECSYLALKMGLGKTAISLYWAKEVLTTAKGILVVAPLRAITTTWPDEIAKWQPQLTYTILHGTKKDAAYEKKSDLYIINFEGLPWLFKKLKQSFKLTKKVPMRAAIIDEGSMIKSPSTKRFKIIRKIKDIFPTYRMILSGTPSPNSLLDLWSQYFFLDDGRRLGKVFSHFRQEHFKTVDRDGFVWVINKGADKIIHKQVGDITFSLDEKEHIKLPKRIDNVISVNLTPKQRKEYENLQEMFFDNLPGVMNDPLGAITLAAKMRQYLQGAIYTGVRIHKNQFLDKDGKVVKNNPYTIVHKEKLNVLKSLVEEANGQGILCAIQFRFELDMIHSVYPKAPVIAGGVKPAEATKYIRDWNKGKVPLLLCHPASLSHSVNLQTGSHIILWYGMPWSLEQYLQLNARLHRQGQTKNVIVHHLIVKNSTDERVVKALKYKHKNQREFLQYIIGLR